MVLCCTYSVSVTVTYASSFPQAPEIAGTIVRCLVDIGAAIFGRVYAVIEEFRDFNLKEDSTTAEDVHKVFGRFVDTLNQAR